LLPGALALIMYFINPSQNLGWIKENRYLVSIYRFVRLYELYKGTEPFPSLPNQPLSPSSPITHSIIVVPEFDYYPIGMM
jgi:hypothetical protein